MSRDVRKHTFWHAHPTRLKPTCLSAQSDKSLRCPHEETLHPWLSKMRPVRILIRQRECAGWSDSSLGTHVRRYVFLHCGSNDFDTAALEISQLAFFIYLCGRGGVRGRGRGRYRPVSYHDGPITARYRFIKNAYWDDSTHTGSAKK